MYPASVIRGHEPANVIDSSLEVTVGQRCDRHVDLRGYIKVWPLGIELTVHVLDLAEDDLGRVGVI